MGFFDSFARGFNDFIFFNVFGHLLFIVVLCGIYTLKSWKGVSSYLVFFMIGMAFTFYISWLDFFRLSGNTLKILIPVTVIVTAFTNFFVKKGVFTNKYPSQNYRYYFALIAGLIHGFAFGASRAGGFFGDSLGYSLGLIVCIWAFAFVFLLVALILTYFLRVRLREWNLIISGASAGVAVFKLFMGM